MERMCKYGASCKHFAAGDCYFSHVPDGGPGGFCWFFAHGACKFGQGCGKRHWKEPRAQEMEGRQLQCTPCAAPREETARDGVEAAQGEARAGEEQESRGQGREGQKTVQGVARVVEQVEKVVKQRGRGEAGGSISEVLQGGEGGGGRS